MGSSEALKNARSHSRTLPLRAGLVERLGKADQDVDEARRLMAEHEIDRILVTEGDHLVGIISEADIRRDEGPLA